ncbi:MAG: hypothetical protein RR204_00840 [Raoultibacter sp.]
MKAMQKPTFDRDQIVPATTASKKFAAVRQKAKLMPQFISDHNEISTVVLDYTAYEKMFIELNLLREQQFYSTAANRIKEGDQNPSRASKSLREVMGEEEYKEYQLLDPHAIADEDLFE